ncbi:MAG: prolipoprotein diacylglyceryl transferase [Deltaproteobacteria bacterium]|nr:prolipoprotein diacylglyceryl transferase [Deltaproteobacteria bacterium]
MYAAAILLSAATVAGTTGLPFVHLGSFKLPIINIPIQAFGVIVAAGVLIGAHLLRRYAEWHKVGDDKIRGLTAWITVTGFIGAHVFDVLAYQWPELQKDPLLLIKIWSGISSYGGFIGGAAGFAFYVWWKRLPPRLMADIGVVGLLPAFSIGRIGCTVVSDHIGRAVDPTAWYAALAMEYPRFGDAVLQNGQIAQLALTNPGTSPTILAWNLGFIELLYLIPVNALLLYIAFRRKRPPAGLIAVLSGMLYAPVRFFLDYLRPETTDPRYIGLTFAQWSSIAFFAVSAYAASRMLKNGAAAETLAPTSREAQEMLNMELKESDDDDPKKKGAKAGKDPKAVAAAKEIDAAKAEERRKAKELEDERLEAKRKQDDAEEIQAAERRKKQDEEAAAKKAAAEAAKKNAPEAPAETAAPTVPTKKPKPKK